MLITHYTAISLEHLEHNKRFHFITKASLNEHVQKLFDEHQLDNDIFTYQCFKATII